MGGLRRNNVGRRGGNAGSGDSTGNRQGATRFRVRIAGRAVRLEIGDFFVGEGQRGKKKEDDDEQGRQIPVQKTPQQGRGNSTGKRQNRGRSRILQF